MVDRETEIRKLRPAELYALAKTLSPYSWKILMGIIPKSESDSSPMFNSEHVGMIECAAAKQHRCPAEIFLDEWGTWGRKRPTVNSVINLSIKAQLFRTADYLAVEILKTLPPERPQLGPAAPVEIPEDFIDHLSLEDSPENSNTEYCRQSTVEAGHEQNIAYPSRELPDFSKLNAVSRTDDIREFKVNYSESAGQDKAQNELNLGNQSVSDLIKFSNEFNDSNKSEEEKINNGTEKSENLIKFSSDNIKEIQYGVEQSGSFLPNLEALKLNMAAAKESESIPIIPQNLSNGVPFQLPEELQSFELPLCIKKVRDENSDIDIESSCTESKSSNYSQESSRLIGSSVSDDLNNNQSQQEHTPINRRINSNNSDTFKSIVCPAPIDSQELPLTVLEFSKR
ncbi:uncharacterized protein tub [Chelonus insularis]|uniref:uncharacterized protein tub n=1 Tax=Chelonus insularis TaxID=460826 RepID=UPI00158A9C49|nr:uncharacterized protein LOC118069821 [Chelonus insularis]